ncbi:hypothetical protein BGY98DRAFT_966425, partial [Russula aff. rugulosa BPL654]
MTLQNPLKSVMSGEKKRIQQPTDGDSSPRFHPSHNLIHPQTTTKSRAAQNGRASRLPAITPAQAQAVEGDGFPVHQQEHIDPTRLARIHVRDARLH